MIDQAIKRICPNAAFTLIGYDIEYKPVLDHNGNYTGEYETPNFNWMSTEYPKPTKQQIETALAEIEAERAELKYRSLRKREYPPIEDLADAIYWQAQGDDTKMDAYVAQVDAVKLKYPKGVS